MHGSGGMGCPDRTVITIIRHRRGPVVQRSDSLGLLTHKPAVHFGAECMQGGGVRDVQTPYYMCDTYALEEISVRTRGPCCVRDTRGTWQ